MTPTHPFEFSRSVDVHKLPRKPKHLKWKASADECSALAARFELPGMTRFNADAVVTTGGGGQWARAEVTVTAEHSVECVVSLTIFETRTAVTFTRVFREGLSDDLGETGFISSDRQTSDADADPMEDGRFDLGDAIAEEFGLALDTFPKAPGVEFDGKSVDAPPSFAEDDEIPKPQKASPFAALEKIRDKLAKE